MNIPSNNSIVQNSDAFSHSLPDTFLGSLFQGLVVDDGKAVLEVDVVAGSSDPAEAQPQADAVYGDGLPSLYDRAAVVPSC